MHRFYKWVPCSCAALLMFIYFTLCVSGAVPTADYHAEYRLKLLLYVICYIFAIYKNI